MSTACNSTNLLRGLICAALCVCLAASPLEAKNKNGVGRGSAPIYYYAESDDLGLLPEVKSNGTDSKQLVFRDAKIDLGQITDCNYDSVDGTNDGLISGVLVLQPKSNKNPYVATLTFWFDATLVTGGVVTHRFYMEGVFDDLSDWPPVVATKLYFDSWEVAAENPRAQRNDCDDAHGPGIVPRFEVSVRHE